jgi:hypothetical protein
VFASLFFHLLLTTTTHGNDACLKTNLLGLVMSLFFFWFFETNIFPCFSGVRNLETQQRQYAASSDKVSNIIHEPLCNA